MIGSRRAPIPTDGMRTGPRLVIAEAVLAETERLLRTFGHGQHEGVVYWGGLEGSGVSAAVCAFAPSATTNYGSFRTDAEANGRLIEDLGRRSLRLVAQVHSHPGAWVDHSDGDDLGALVRFAGFWSLVVPSFAVAGMRPLTRCGVHVFADGQFRRLTEIAIEARVQVAPASVDLRRP